MNEIVFKATIRRFGNSHGVTIPAEYVGHEVHEGETYFLKLKLNETRRYP